MVTTNTILSQKDLVLLEDVILQYGKIVSFDQLKAAFGALYSAQELRNHISSLSKKGWLLRLKRGLYVVITDVSTLGLSDVSDYVIAQALNAASYISLAAALQYHGMYDQKLSVIESMTKDRARTYVVAGNKTYRFSHLREDLYFGFGKKLLDGQWINMAEREKALLDMLYMRLDILTASMVLEKLTDYRDDLDFQKLKQYTTHYSLRMIRTIGFLLDRIGVQTDALHASSSVQGNTYSTMTTGADTFNAKWRLYYDPKLT